MIDISPALNVVITTGSWGNVSITQKGNYYFLQHSKEEWNCFNSHNNREIYEQWSGYDMAYGNVLISGFGFGHFAVWLASKPEVTSVTVLELSQDVIDAFLSNNILPDKVSIIITDANKYKTDKHYDCIIFDHISNNIKPKVFYQELCQVVKHIPHNLFWFWSLEAYYLYYYYELKLKDFYVNPVDFNLFDFSLHWNQLLQDFDIDTIPNLSKEKLKEYLYVFFLRHLIQ